VLDDYIKFRFIITGISSLIRSPYECRKILICRFNYRSVYIGGFLDIENGENGGDDAVSNISEHSLTIFIVSVVKPHLQTDAMPMCRPGHILCHER
jgi:hypothetical protein